MAKSRSRSRAGIGEYQKALSRAVKQPAPVIVLEGPEPFLRREAEDRLAKALKKKTPGIEVIILRGDPQAGKGVGISDLLAELATDSLFATDRLVVLRGADATLFGRGAASGSSSTGRNDPESRLLEYLSDPSERTTLVVDLEKLPRNRRVGKALAKASVIPCPSVTRRGDVTQWLSRIAHERSKDLAPGASDVLCGAHGHDLGVLHGEIDKLATYVGDKHTIEESDVRAFLSGSVEFDVFGLTNAVEARDLESALLFARRIGGQGLRDAAGKRSDGTASSHRAISMLSNTVEGILQARVLAGARVDAASAASSLGVSPWRAEHLLRAAQRYSMAELRTILGALCESMRRAHDTGGDVRLELERCALACCRVMAR